MPEGKVLCSSNEMMSAEGLPLPAVFASAFSASFLLELDVAFLLLATTDKVESVSFLGLGDTNHRARWERGMFPFNS
jgi:hypothetical protein